MALTAKGKNNGSSNASAPNATNSPLPTIALMKSGPPTWPDEERRAETAKITGTAGSTPIPAIVGGGPKMILSPDRRNRVEMRTRGGLPTTSSAADIEALTGQRH